MNNSERLVAQGERFRDRGRNTCTSDRQKKQKIFTVKLSFSEDSNGIEDTEGIDKVKKVAELCFKLQEAQETEVSVHRKGKRKAKYIQNEENKRKRLGDDFRKPVAKSANIFICV